MSESRRGPAVLGTLLVVSVLVGLLPRLAAASIPGKAPAAPAVVFAVLFDNAHAETAGNADWIISTSQPDPLAEDPNPQVETDWTGGGLNAPQNVKEQAAGTCGILLEGTPTGFIEPEGFKPNQGQFFCDPKNVIQLHDDYSVLPISELRHILRAEVIDEIVFAVDSDRLAELEDVFLLCDEEGVSTRVALLALGAGVTRSV